MKKEETNHINNNQQDSQSCNAQSLGSYYPLQMHDVLDFSCSYPNKTENQPTYSCKKKPKVTLESWAYSHGTILPKDFVKVKRGSDITFRIKAHQGYHIQDIMVDGERITDEFVLIETLDEYDLTIENVKEKHRIEAFFDKK